jgi:signal transduction histidine kinase
LKSPINIIIGFSDKLVKSIEKYQADKIQQFATEINQTSKITFDLLENLLFEMEKLKPNPMLVNANEIIGEAIQLLSRSANQKNISLNPIFFANKN